MSYSWHKEYYELNMKKIASTAGTKLAHFHEWHGEQPQGWEEWLSEQHPTLYMKYLSAQAKIAHLWGNKDPDVLEDWKAAIKIEIEASQWAVDKYIEYQLKILRGEAQEALV